MIVEYQWPQAMDSIGETTYANLPRSLSHVLEASYIRRPSQLAITASDGEFTYRDVWERALQVARYLKGLGIRSGDRVVLRLSNTGSFVCWLFGALQLGALVTPTNYRFSAAEFQPLHALLRPAVTICEASDENLSLLPGRIIDERAYLSVPTGPSSKVDIASDTPAIMFLTSGTSGAPKGVPLSHENMLTSVETYRRIFTLDASDVTLITVPLFHVTGLIGQLLTIFSVGGTAVLVKRFDEGLFFDGMQKYRGSFVFGVPTIFLRLLNYLAVHKVPPLPNWRVAASGGAPMPPSLMAAFKEKFPALHVYNTYGMTELSSPATILPAEEAGDRPGSVGHAVPFAQLRVVDGHTGLDVGKGELGELWVRGPMVSRGYWGTDRRVGFSDGGWMMSRDLARIDDAGFVYIVDRMKDLINRGGEKIFPGEVENVLYQYPDIAEASVVGVPDEIWGESVAALVVPKPRCKLETSDIQHFLARHISRYKVPTVWMIADGIPKNANGKVNKKAVKELIRGEHKALFEDAPGGARP